MRVEVSLFFFSSTSVFSFNLLFRGQFCNDRETGALMGTTEEVRADGRTRTQLRALAFTRNLLHRAHGSAQWSQGLKFRFGLPFILLSILFSDFFFLNQGTLLYWPRFMGPKREQRKGKILRKCRLKSFGSRKLDRLVMFFFSLSEFPSISKLKFSLY